MADCPDQTKDTIANLISKAQEHLDLSDEAIAGALGYNNPAVMRQIKDGQIRLPLNKAALLAQAVEMEPGEVMRMLLGESSPEMLIAIEECMGPLCLSPGERRLITALRKSAQGRASTPIFIEGASIFAVVVG